MFSVACCCGAPAYLAWPAAQQYPVSAVLPAAVADLRLREDASSRRAADGLAERLRDTGPVGTDVFAGIYTDRNGKRVALFGTTGFRLTPKSDLEAEVQHLTGDYGLRDVQEFDLGQTGAHQRCGVGRADGKSVVVCGWADHGSLATVLLTRRSLAESADLVSLLRQSVLTRG